MLWSSGLLISSQLGIFGIRKYSLVKKIRRTLFEVSNWIETNWNCISYISLYHHKRTRRTQPYRPYFLCYIFQCCSVTSSKMSYLSLLCPTTFPWHSCHMCAVETNDVMMSSPKKHTHTQLCSRSLELAPSPEGSHGFGTAPRFLIRLAAFTFSCEYSMVCFRPVCWCESSLQDLWSLSRRIV